MGDRANGYQGPGGFNPPFIPPGHSQQISNAQLWQQTMRQRTLQAGGGEMNPQMRQQMEDLVRSQQMAAHLQAQNMPQQSFNPQAMNQGFHDPQNTHHQGLPSAFPMGMQSNASRNAMIQAAMQNANSSPPNAMSRQLEMIQNQNQGNQNFSRNIQGQDMFDGGGVPRPGMPGNPTFNRTAQQNMATVMGKAREIGEELKRIDADLATLGNNRAGLADAVFVSQSNQLHAAKREKLELMQKFKAYMAHATGNSGGPPQTPLQPPHNRMGNSPGLMNAMPAGSPSANQQPSSAQLLALASRQAVPNSIRPGPSPRPTMTPQLPPRGSPNPQKYPALGPSGIPPLDTKVFDNAFKSFVSARGMVLDPRLLNFDGRQIDLHQLHCTVVAEGGFNTIVQKDSWPIVGAQMGFVQFPGSETEPAKAGPAIAGHLAHIYKECLHDFDQAYFQSVINQRLRQSGAASNDANLHPPQPPSNPSAPQMATHARTFQGQIQSTMHLVKHSAAELRAMKVPEGAINFVEANRVMIQRAADEHIMREGKGPPAGLNLDGQPQQPQPGQLQQHHVAGGGPQQYSITNLQAQQHQILAQRNAAMRTILMTARVNPPQAMPENMPRMSPDQVSHILALLARMRHEILSTNLPAMSFQVVLDSDRQQFSAGLEMLAKASQIMETKLQLYFTVVKNEDAVRKLLAIIISAYHQRNLLQQTPPQFVLSLNMVKTMYTQVQSAFGHIRDVLAQRQKMIQTGGTMPPGSSSSPPPSIGNGHIPIEPPGRRGAISYASPPPVTAPSPANAPTPTFTAPSPQMNAKASPKPKPKPKAPATRSRKASTSISKTAVESPPTAISTPPAPPSSQQQQGTKRPHEEEINDNVAGPSNYSENAPSPPKKSKTSEWDGETSQALLKKQGQIESIKTEDDASAFMEQMSELIKMADGPGGSLSSQISSALDQFLEGYGGGDVIGDGSSSYAGPATTQPSPPAAVDNDEFVEFFDFSSFGEDDTDSKAPTPELSSVSTSTNPSPESQPGFDHHLDHQPQPQGLDTAKVVEVPSNKDDDPQDPLRIGAWKDIDGGESAYFQPDKFQYDGQIATTDQPWAIFPTS